MAGNQAVVEFLLKWSESGGQLPDKVKRDLDNMAKGSQNASSITDRLGDAFGRLEKREPSLFVRRARTEITQLAASAAGAHNPLAGLALDFASMADLAAGLGVAVGAGGLALSIKAMVSPMDTATKSARELHDALDKNATAVDRINAAFVNLAAGASRTASIWTGIRTGLESVGLGGIADFFAGKSLAAGGAAAVGLTGDRQQIGARFLADKVKQAQLQGQGTGAQWAREAAELGLTPQQQAEARRWGERYDAAKPDRRLNPQVEAQRRAAQQFLTERLQIQADLANMTRRSGPWQMRIISTGTGKLPQGLEGAIDLSRRGLEIPFGADYAMAHGMTMADLGRFGPAGGGTDTGAILTALLGLAGSARGGAAGVVSGFGGLASAAFRSTPIIGQALSFAGGLLGLFSSGQAKVSISRLESEALDQVRRLAQIPQNVSANVITGARSIQQAKSDIARLGARDAVSTLPG